MICDWERVIKLQLQYFLFSWPLKLHNNPVLYARRAHCSDYNARTTRTELQFTFFSSLLVCPLHTKIWQKNIFHLQIEVCCSWLLSFCHTFVNKQSFFYIVNCHFCHFFHDFSFNYQKLQIKWQHQSSPKLWKILSYEYLIIK